MYKRIVEGLTDFFGISRKEARGALVLMILSFCLIWTPFIFRRAILPLLPAGAAPVDLAKLDSIAAMLEKEHSRKYKGKGYERKEFKKEEPRPVRLFDFDPNTVSVAEFQDLGVPLFLAKRIEKFRSKGGKFRKKEDLLAIYDFPSDLYQKLQKHIKFAANTVQQADKGQDKKSPDTWKKQERRAISAFDINKADTTELVKLRGIGSKLSLRIIKFRDGLGGFHSTRQYQEIFGLDSVAIAELNRFAKVLSPVRKLNINEISAEDLGRHSYVRNKKLAAIIMNYRSQHGPFRSLEDLRKVKVIDENMLNKLEPYLSF
ncbi:ComEA family DNA-binding protein [Dyadobacter bucti]|uniref:ComEA family DNA-binding protein n=1 Tax=Dyadobacter bucti TaxID=2572203 RepID=UPI003F72E586